MLILTQDGLQVVKFKDITDLFVDYINDYASHAIYYKTKDIYDTPLGSYKTKERCKEVLKDLVEHYDKLEKSKLYAKGSSYYNHEKSFVFYMPEE